MHEGSLVELKNKYKKNIGQSYNDGTARILNIKNQKAILNYPLYKVGKEVSLKKLRKI